MCSTNASLDAAAAAASAAPSHAPARAAHASSHVTFAGAATQLALAFASRTIAPSSSVRSPSVMGQ